MIESHEAVYVAEIHEEPFLDVPLLPDQYNPFRNRKKRQIAPSLARSATASIRVHERRQQRYDALASVFPERTVFESEDGSFRYGSITRYVIDEDQTSMTAEEYVEEHFIQKETQELLDGNDPDDLEY